MSKRFIQISWREAVDRGYPVWWADEGVGGWDNFDWSQVIIELNPDGTFKREVATDGGEPEDNSFNRDYSWIVAELNKLAEEA